MEAEASGKIVKIGDAEIGAGRPCFVIAEAGVNHNGSVALAEELVRVAAGAKADAVKFQTFKSELLVTADAPKAAYQVKNTGDTGGQFEMLKKLELRESDYRELKKRAKSEGIVFLSSPFDETTADFLESLDVPAFKIPSGEITNLRYLRHIAAKRRPMIVSTGMATLSEVETAVREIERAGNDQIVLLHCVSNYPAPPGDINLRAMETMRRAFGYPVGYSDHSTGIEIALAAVALGACMIEKHFTTDTTLPGPDHVASLPPEELAKMMEGIRAIEAALGNGRKSPSASELDTAVVARKSFVAAREIAAGETLTATMLVMRRPGSGIPGHLEHALVGRKAVARIPAGTLLRFDMLT